MCESKQKLHDICDSKIDVINKVEAGHRSSAFDHLNSSMRHPREIARSTNLYENAIFPQSLV